MFRCPSCATVWKLPLTKGYALLAQKEMKKYTVEKEPISFLNQPIYVENLHELLGVFTDLDINFKTTKGITLKDDILEETDVIKCPSCYTEDTFENWNKAWELPGDFFDADQLCSCGGELWYDNIPGTSKYALICEECGWIKPRNIISGHAE